MKKQLMSSIVCFALLVVMFLGSSIAWFTDEQTNVNVMVAGKIAIEQTEKDKDGNDFENNTFVMMPTKEIVKTVTVTNTGNQPAYVRTLFAFEDGTIEGDGKSVLEYVNLSAPDGVSIVIPGVTDNEKKIQFTVSVPGENDAEGKPTTVTTTYSVGYYQYADALPCDDPATAAEENNSCTCLNSITLSKDATSAWSEAADGIYEVFVLSQAVQATGFEQTGATGAFGSTFGEINVGNAADWFGAVLQNTAGWESAVVKAVITEKTP